MRLEGRVAIVTGAAHGIGRAICVELAREGARVWACDVRAAELAATRAAVDAVRAGAGETAVVDVRDARAAAAFVARVDGAAGRVDILVNTAAGVGAGDAPGRGGLGRGVARDLRGQPRRRVPLHARGGARDEAGRARRHREHLLGRRAVLQPHRHPGLRERQGGPDRAHPADRARAGPSRHPGQLGRARLHAHEPGHRAAVGGDGRGRAGPARGLDRARAARRRRRTWRARCSSSSPTTRATSPARPSASTAGSGCSAEASPRVDRRAPC